ncbi:MAG TPA: hypothetical protein VFI02_00405 [Armatimonadota bacterium]|nr:hypothetical protein [Armatimonadota bacterium]
MLTATNRNNRQSQEILANDNGDLMVMMGHCQSLVVTDSGTQYTGACMLMGALLIAGTETAMVAIESNADIKLKIKVSATGTSPILFPIPVYCPEDLHVTITGEGAIAVIYYASA